MKPRRTGIDSAPATASGHWETQEDRAVSDPPDGDRHRGVGRRGQRGEFAPDIVEQYSGGAPPGHTSELLMIGGFPEVPGAVRTAMVQPAGGGEPVEATVYSES